MMISFDIHRLLKYYNIQIIKYFFTNAAEPLRKFEYDDGYDAVIVN